MHIYAIKPPDKRQIYNQRVDSKLAKTRTKRLRPALPHSDGSTWHDSLRTSDLPDASWPGPWDPGYLRQSLVLYDQVSTNEIISGADEACNRCTGGGMSDSFKMHSIPCSVRRTTAAVVVRGPKVIQFKPPVTPTITNGMASHACFVKEITLQGGRVATVKMINPYLALELGWENALLECDELAYRQYLVAYLGVDKALKADKMSDLSRGEIQICYPEDLCVQEGTIREEVVWQKVAHGVDEILHGISSELDIDFKNRECSSCSNLEASVDYLFP
ncbi:hypothetical protein ETB97_001814 [Aspergillus alliaceus]|uniref:Uncharacterized protein n=1 Tax=Petromyces alliaceus TaxID=209559 RepID=A0A8H6A5F4_PETAA|nr:hypothetical protein ETB97_001814 [Aspergillus burnettii]